MSRQYKSGDRVVVSDASHPYSDQVLVVIGYGESPVITVRAEDPRGALNKRTGRRSNRTLNLFYWRFAPAPSSLEDTA